MRKLLGLGAALALLVVGLPAQVAQAAEFEVLIENFAFDPGHAVRQRWATR